jgi:predicted kinase
MLFIFSGLPGVGKTTLAKKLSQALEAAYIRIDTIEQAIKNAEVDCKDSPDYGYQVAYALIKDNLSLGRIVVADSVNPLEITRNAFRQCAIDANTQFTEIEVICSDKTEHQKRVETRSSDISGQILPDWNKVREREYEHWKRELIVIDTAGKSIEGAFGELLKALKHHGD